MERAELFKQDQLTKEGQCLIFRCIKYLLSMVECDELYMFEIIFDLKKRNATMN